MSKRWEIVATDEKGNIINVFKDGRTFKNVYYAQSKATPMIPYFKNLHIREIDIITELEQKDARIKELEVENKELRNKIDRLSDIHLSIVDKFLDIKDKG